MADVGPTSARLAHSIEAVPHLMSPWHLNDDGLVIFSFVNITKCAMSICYIATIALSYTYHSMATIAVHRSTAVLIPSSNQSEHMRRHFHRLLTWPRHIPMPIAGSRNSLPAFCTEETRAPCTRQAANTCGPEEACTPGGVAKQAVPAGACCLSVVVRPNAVASGGAVRWNYCDQRGLSGPCRRQHQLDRALQWRHVVRRPGLLDN